MEWLDSLTFEYWFFKMFLFHAEHLHGKVIFIGDNLVTHFTLSVIKVCENNNIVFLTLPPNSTHLCQSLDVRFFPVVQKQNMRHTRKPCLSLMRHVWSGICKKHFSIVFYETLPQEDCKKRVWTFSHKILSLQNELRSLREWRY